MNIKNTEDERNSPLSPVREKEPVRKKKSVTACPSDEDLSAYVDGVADREVRAQITAHLNQCPTCYQQWLDVSEVIRGVHEPANKKPKTNPALSCYQMINRSSWQLKAVLLTMALASSLALALSLWWPRS